MISLPPLGLGDIPLYPWVLWVLWTNRNKLLFENKQFSEENSVLKAIQDARAWKAAQTSWNPSTGNCGLGWYLQDAEKVHTDCFSSHRRFVSSALVAEALAVKAAIMAATSSHVSSLNVFSDSKVLISLLKSQTQDVALKGVLHDIIIMAQTFQSISFHFIPCLANVVADSLAKSALYSLQSSVTATI
ncbi:uncharacterized protein LOC103836687 isoform X1 [Brassica rapa]|uniref:uncharacterized protein LOC103836687 isoform X1 n=1 Tax=Brassica campestris TaxID=3711 RepID=UPI00142D7F56|nr:uncharacterized protein LOC103836687 isoform X1 [Brassica rapa]